MNLRTFWNRAISSKLVQGILALFFLLFALTSDLGRAVFDVYYYAGYKLGHALGSLSAPAMDHSLPETPNGE
ncbi:MAG: hypothetical protein KM296_04235 [Brockia lithotrophica]|nr:hypothetical protein [Brockia lithotrophica]